jgi:hypothetical protein
MPSLLRGAIIIDVNLIQNTLFPFGITPVRKGRRPVVMCTKLFVGLQSSPLVIAVAHPARRPMSGIGDRRH